MSIMNGIDLSPIEELWEKKAEAQRATGNEPGVQKANTRNSKTIFRYVFNFYEKHAGKEKDWETINDEMQDIAVELDSPFADALLIAVKEELEREAGLF